MPSSASFRPLKWPKAGLAVNPSTRMILNDFIVFELKQMVYSVQVMVPVDSKKLGFQKQGLAQSYKDVDADPGTLWLRAASPFVALLRHEVTRKLRFQPTDTCSVILSRQSQKHKTTSRSISVCVCQ